MSYQLGQDGWGELTKYSYIITIIGIVFQILIIPFLNIKSVKFSQEEDSFGFFESELTKFKELISSPSQQRFIYFVTISLLGWGFLNQFWYPNILKIHSDPKEFIVGIFVGLSMLIGPLITQILIIGKLKQKTLECVYMIGMEITLGILFLFLVTGIQIDQNLLMGLTLPIAIIISEGMLVLLIHNYSTLYNENFKIFPLFLILLSFFRMLILVVQTIFDSQNLIDNNSKILAIIMVTVIIITQAIQFIMYLKKLKFGSKAEEEYFESEIGEQEMQRYNFSTSSYRQESSEFSLQNRFNNLSNLTIQSLPDLVKNPISRDKSEDFSKKNQESLDFRLTYQEFQMYFRKIEVICHSRDNTTVSKYMNKKDQQIYAVKQIYVNTKQELQEKKREIFTMQQIAHMEFVVKIHHYVEIEYENLDNFQLFIIMDLAECSMKDEIINKKSLNIQQAKQISKNLIQQLAELFEKAQISHRDIKPHNILKFKDNIYKLADFGEAKIHSLQTITQTHITVCGTEKYLSPELKQNYDHIKENDNKQVIYCDQQKADVYSLGLTLLEAITLENIKDFNTLKGQERLKLVIGSIKDKELQKLISNMLIYDAGKRMTFTFLKSQTCNNLNNSSNNNKSLNLSGNSNNNNSPNTSLDSTQPDKIVYNSQNQFNDLIQRPQKQQKQNNQNIQNKNNISQLQQQQLQQQDDEKTQELQINSRQQSQNQNNFDQQNTENINQDNTITEIISSSSSINLTETIENKPSQTQQQNINNNQKNNQIINQNNISINQRLQEIKEVENEKGSWEYDENEDFNDKS